MAEQWHHYMSCSNVPTLEWFCKYQLTSPELGYTFLIKHFLHCVQRKCSRVLATITYRRAMNPFTRHGSLQVWKHQLVGTRVQEVNICKCQRFTQCPLVSPACTFRYICPRVAFHRLNILFTLLQCFIWREAMTDPINTYKILCSYPSLTTFLNFTWNL